MSTYEKLSAMISEDELERIAFRFRKAIIEAVDSGTIREMSSFPIGCCTYASNLLQRYLSEREIFTWYMSGQYGYGFNSESHAWLETYNGIVIDITGDQYKYKALMFTTPVYVGSRADGFHDKFRLSAPMEYSNTKDPFVSYSDFDRRYDAVMRYYVEHVDTKVKI